MNILISYFNVYKYKFISKRLKCLYKNFITFYVFLIFLKYVYNIKILIYDF